MRLVNWSDLDHLTRQLMDEFPGPIEEPYKTIVRPFVEAAKTLAQLPSLDHDDRSRFIRDVNIALSHNVLAPLEEDDGIGDWL